jgi:hypothetical protein
MERLLRAERETAVAQAEGRKLAKEVLDDFMVLFAGMAAHHQPMPRGQAAPPGREPDEAKFEKYARLAIATAADLAPYQSPTFKAIAVMTPQMPTLGGGDVLSLEHAVEMSIDDRRAARAGPAWFPLTSTGRNRTTARSSETASSG